MKKKLHLKNILLGVLMILVIGLVGYNLRDILFGPPLTITIASDGATIEDTYLPISGITKHARELLINGRPVTFDRLGNFADGVLLSTGYNIIEVALKDQFGTTKVKRYHVVVLSPGPTVARTEGAFEDNL